MKERINRVARDELIQLIASLRPNGIEPIDYEDILDLIVAVIRLENSNAQVDTCQREVRKAG